jgi:glutamate synthase domain-containing protein 1
MHDHDRFILFYFCRRLSDSSLTMRHRQRASGAAGLWDPANERDACGVGLVVDRRGARGGGGPCGVLPLALTALARLSHRGAVDADGRTGDGAGVMTQIPHALLADELGERGVELPDPGMFATGLVFLPRGQRERRSCRETVARVLAARGLKLLAWRKPPVSERALGEKALGCCPEIAQLFVERPDGLSGEEFERHLFLARKRIERQLRRFVPDRFSVVSLSHRTLVYKALVRGVDLAAFYRDLENPLYETAFALFHQRYSTNTSPSWALAQPFRMLAHNGEINTIAGNRARMRAREASIEAAGELGQRELLPLIEDRTSDSGSLDNAAELLVRSGRSFPHAMAMLLPPAWENDHELDPGVRAFYEYHSGLMERAGEHRAPRTPRPRRPRRRGPRQRRSPWDQGDPGASLRAGPLPPARALPAARGSGSRHVEGREVGSGSPRQ